MISREKNQVKSKTK